jgi:hypothetical protein
MVLGFISDHVLVKKICQKLLTTVFSRFSTKIFLDAKSKKMNEKKNVKFQRKEKVHIDDVYS